MFGQELIEAGAGRAQQHHIPRMRRQPRVVVGFLDQVLGRGPLIVERHQLVYRRSTNIIEVAELMKARRPRRLNVTTGPAANRTGNWYRWANSAILRPKNRPGEVAALRE